MLAAILACVGAFTGIGALVNSVLARRSNQSNGRAVTALEEGKLDVSVATLGHSILMDAFTQLRLEVESCHEERDEFRAILLEQGLIPR